MEHRHGSRYKTHCAVYVASIDGALSATGVLSNASVSGCFIRTPLPASLLIRVCVRFVGESGPAEVKQEGQVIRRTAEGIGVEWTEYQSDLLRQLLSPTPVESSMFLSRSRIRSTTLKER